MLIKLSVKISQFIIFYNSKQCDHVITVLLLSLVYHFVVLLLCHSPYSD